MVFNKSMSPESLRPRYKKMLLDLINQYIPRGKIILFGSRARGDATRGSDIVDYYDLPDEFKLAIEREGIVWRS